MYKQKERVTDLTDRPTTQYSLDPSYFPTNSLIYLWYITFIIYNIT